jgi:hypothetical protein
VESSSLRQESREASIVSLGEFNPAIYQPHWFSSMNLIRREEAAESKVTLIHQEAAVFSTDWLKVEVTGDRFAVATGDPAKFLPLRDVATGTFRILEHTPVRAVGLNSIHHFSTGSVDDWHAIGDHFAPKPSWGKILEKPGLRILVMEGRRHASPAKYVWVRIEPATRKVGQGIDISVNEHFDLDKGSTPQERMQSYLATIEEHWEGFLQYADGVCDELFRQALTKSD